jgi:glutamine---fructose-6-phosphate transaminase (isomerizing)
MMPAPDVQAVFSDPDQFCLGDEFLDRIWESARELKQEVFFQPLFFDPGQIQALSRTAQTLSEIITFWQDRFTQEKPALPARTVEIISLRMEKLKDIHWCIKQELLGNINAISGLVPPDLFKHSHPEGMAIFKRINAVLNSIDRLEVRGRDSAGISVLFTLDHAEFERFRAHIAKAGLSDLLKQRTNHLVLANNCINIHEQNWGDTRQAAISFVYKFCR